jgi:hypothetical protein
MGEVQDETHNASSALRFVFPDLDALDDFERSDPAVARVAVPELVRFAREHGLIAGDGEADLRLWLERDGSHPVYPPAELSFGELMDRIAGGRPVIQLIDRELRPLARRIGLPEVQASMISRLRRRFVPNTRGKRNLLRVLAFWIGLRHPAWRWDFRALLQLQDAAGPSRSPVVGDGVRIAFRVAARGGPHEGQALQWLHQAVAGGCRDLGLADLTPDPMPAAATTVQVSVPRLGDERDDAPVYARPLRDAVALAHQTVVRWGLGDFSASHALTVALAAGPFAGLDGPLQAMLKARLFDRDPLRVTSLVHTCAGLSEIKIVFRPEPHTVALYADDTLEVWVADSLWSHIYYDVVPAVERLIPDDPAGLASFRAALAAGDSTNNRALAAALAQPDNTLLLLDLAKACLARGLFHEADRFVSIILAHRPFHVVARTLRVVIQLNIGLSRADLAFVCSSLRDALHQGSFILDRCPVENEEPYCELGQVHFSLARRLYQGLAGGRTAELANALRQFPEAVSDSGGWSEPEVRDRTRRLILEQLRLAADRFDQGRTISPTGTGHRSLHWSFRIRALLALFQADPQAFEPAGWPDGVVLDRQDVFRDTARRILAQLGWAADPSAGRSPATEAPLADWPTRILQAFDRYDNAVRSAPYRANVRYAFAALVYDFAPELTVGMLRFVLGWLGEAEAQAAAIAARPRGARSIITCFSQIQPAVRLAEGAAQARRLLLERHRAELDRGDDAEVVRGREHKFLLASFTRPVDVADGELC